MKKYFEWTNGNVEGEYRPAISMSIRYDKGDTAGYRPVERGYYVTFAPVGISPSGWTKGFPVQSVRSLLLTVKRASSSKELEAEKRAIEMVDRVRSFFEHNGIVMGEERTLQEILSQKSG